MVTVEQLVRIQEAREAIGTGEPCNAQGVTGDMGMTASEADYISIRFPSLPSNISLVIRRVKALGFGAGISGYNIGSEGWRGSRKTIGQRYIVKGYKVAGFMGIPLWQWRTVIATGNLKYTTTGTGLRVEHDGQAKPDSVKVHGAAHRENRKEAARVRAVKRYERHFQTVKNIAG